MIPHIRDLINNEYLAREFGYDTTICQNFVVYLYKFKLSEQPLYLKN